MNRREFMKISAAAAGAMVPLDAMPIMAGPFTNQDIEQHLIPFDKRLTSSWIKSLTKRGKPEVFSGPKQLTYIGMPIGGICCGQLYLGGDGRLWLWDIFKSQYHREPDHAQRLEAMTLCGHYTKPPKPETAVTRDNGADVEQGFVMRVSRDGKAHTHYMDKRSFKPKDIGFRGEYPIGRVVYDDSEMPVKAQLEAFSPFIPLNAEDSGIPATVLSWKLTNSSDKPVEVDFAGYLENSVCPYDRDSSLGQRKSRSVVSNDVVMLLHRAEPAKVTKAEKIRADIGLADFESNRYPKGWDTDGEAFGNEPFALKNQHHGQSIQSAQGDKIVNTYNPEIAGDKNPDILTGKLTSGEFTIDRKYLSFLISGGPYKNQTCLNLLVDGEVVASVTGRRDNQMRREVIDVRSYPGRKAKIEIVDSSSSAWGIITVDDIRLTDVKPQTASLDTRHGYGSMALALLDEIDSAWVNSSVGNAEQLSKDDILKKPENTESDFSFDRRPVGAVGTHLTLKPGQSKTLRFVLGWYFPDYNQKDFGEMLSIKDFRQLRRHYAPHYGSAGDVIRRIANDWDKLCETTYLWNRTWYDSTLPYWLLDRSFISMDCLASQTCHWFDSGRFWAWEGVDCCAGTCTHVWQYAQGLARIFPQIERGLRKNVDFGLAFNESNGVIGHRGEIHTSPAADGQAGTILRACREHRMTSDLSFLSSIWPRLKLALGYLERLDTDNDSLLDANQPHTLDAAWSGRIAWISSHYLAAAQACAEMADEMGDNSFAEHCRAIVRRGRKQIVEQLYNGEYFIHKPDPKKPQMLNTNTGCHIDQVLGQSFAWQVGLGERVIPRSETQSALESLWKYNFAPDAGGYALKQRDIGKAFRWYAMEGEAGLLMCTWPKGGADKALPGVPKRSKKNPDVWTGPGGYFNECMNGFEYQAASHMIYEGKPGSELVKYGLAVTKAVHERYGAAKRNPYNEIECSDHYARSLASFGVFLAACGYEYHGPKGQLAFAPKIAPENFKAAFTAAQGWGAFSQKRTSSKQTETIDLRWGQLKISELEFEIPKMSKIKKVSVSLEGKPVTSEYKQQGQRVVIRLSQETLVLKANKLIVEMEF